MIRFAENLNKMITAGLGGATEAPSTEVAVGHRVVYTEVSGALVNFETNVIAPVKNLRVTIKPIQEGTGDPSPDNIRPISWRESVTVWREASYDPSADPALTIPLGQTVYGGTVDVTGGNAESEAIKITANDLPTPSVDSGNTGDGYYSFNFVLSAGKYAISGKQLLSKCNILPYIGSGKTNRYAFFYMLEGHFRQLKIVVYSETELTRDTVKQWLSDHGFELVYYTDPTPLTLTPASLSTLRGDNNVWSDAGDVTLEYSYYEETEGY